jgi:Protein of unknown function DUF262
MRVGSTMFSMADADRAVSAAGEAQSCYRYLSLSVREAVELVVAGRWDLPDFQRAFAWRPSQVGDLADSLWRGYPIGHLLIWDSSRTAAHGSSWIADGQQRLTSLCLLFGKQPPWWRRCDVDRHNLGRRFDLRFDIEAAAPPLFRCSFDGEIKDPPGRLISVPELLTHDPASEAGRAALRATALQIKQHGLCRAMNEEEIYGVLHRVCMIKELPLCATSLDCNLDEVLEIFERLNSRGIRFRRLLLSLAMRALLAASRTALRRPGAAVGTPSSADGIP